MKSSRLSSLNSPLTTAVPLKNGACCVTAGANREEPAGEKTELRAGPGPLLLLQPGTAAGRADVPAAWPGSGLRVPPALPALTEAELAAGAGQGPGRQPPPGGGGGGGHLRGGGEGGSEPAGIGARGRPAGGHPLTAVRRSLPSAAAILRGRSGPCGRGRDGAGRGGALC